MGSEDRKKSAGTAAPSWHQLKECCFMGDKGEKSVAKKRLLLHSCCGPCSTSVVERLISNYDITLYFYNPNITDPEEYEKRKATQKNFVRDYNFSPDKKGQLSVITEDYNSRPFYAAVKGLEEEKEGGPRCEKCFRLRLERTAEQARMLGFDAFATTLSVSPHKNHEVISKVGRELACIYRVNFLDEDFKKKDGYKRSVELAKAYNMYRQDYCGCEFSLKEKIERTSGHKKPDR